MSYPPHNAHHVASLPPHSAPRSYKVGGATIASMPASLSVLASVEVDYVTLPGWTEPLSSCKARALNFAFVFAAALL